MRTELQAPTLPCAAACANTTLCQHYFDTNTTLTRPSTDLPQRTVRRRVTALRCVARAAGASECCMVCCIKRSSRMFRCSSTSGTSSSSSSMRTALAFTSRAGTTKSASPMRYVFCRALHCNLCPSFAMAAGDRGAHDAARCDTEGTRARHRCAVVSDGTVVPKTQSLSSLFAACVPKTQSRFLLTGCTAVVYRRSQPYSPRSSAVAGLSVLVFSGTAVV